jgi:hypothetical protein
LWITLLTSPMFSSRIDINVNPERQARNHRWHGGAGLQPVFRQPYSLIRTPRSSYFPRQEVGYANPSCSHHPSPAPYRASRVVLLNAPSAPPHSCLSFSPFRALRPFALSWFKPPPGAPGRTPQRALPPGAPGRTPQRALHTTQYAIRSTQYAPSRVIARY